MILNDIDNLIYQTENSEYLNEISREAALSAFKKRGMHVVNQFKNPLTRNTILKGTATGALKAGPSAMFSIATSHLMPAGHILGGLDFNNLQKVAKHNKGVALSSQIENIKNKLNTPITSKDVLVSTAKGVWDATSGGYAKLGKGAVDGAFKASRDIDNMTRYVRQSQLAAAKRGDPMAQLRTLGK